jgi:mannose-P-dolichol utilization defect protein 1
MLSLVALSCVISSAFAAKRDGLVWGLFTPECHKELVLNLNILHVECMKQFIADMLGYAIVVGAGIVKFPQIIAILRAGNTKGLSSGAYYLETFGYIATVAFNVLKLQPFSTYGESVFILCQNFILILLLWFYAAPGMLEIAAVVGGLAGTSYACFNLVPEEHLPNLYMAVIVIFAVARLPQIYANYAQGHTGQLAFLTLFLNFGGSAARILTTLQNVDEPVVLVGFSISALLNGVLLLQYVVYMKATAAALAAGEDKKTK